MDPYLEQRGLWREIHTQLIVDIARVLSPEIRPHYRVAIEQRTYLTVVGTNDQSAISDVAVVHEPSLTYSAVTSTVGVFVVAELPMPEQIVERFLEVRAIDSNTVVTAIEVLSPTNIITQGGRTAYGDKRMNVLGSLTNLVEIDLLRIGNPFELRTRPSISSDYRVVVSRSWQRPRADLFAFGVRDAIPTIPVPLQKGDTEPLLDLNQILHNLYDSLNYDQLIDYRRSPDPPLRKEGTEWADALLREKRMRS